jgi:hypothetical protein
METTKISHQRIELDWLDSSKVENPKTLILGSFNPFESKVKSVDYYYGRSSNHFWKTIAYIIDIDQNYFFDKQFGFVRKKEIMDNNFCFYDVINSIDFSSENYESLKYYTENEIYKNFKDQKIWTTTTNYKKKDVIKISRNYNDSILRFLENNDSIKKIIHTMGSNRITESKSSPREKKLQEYGFEGFVNNIKSICNRKNIKFIYETYSPSDYAIKNGTVRQSDLIDWLKSNLWFDAVKG